MFKENNDTPSQMKRVITKRSNISGSLLWLRRLQRRNGAYL